MIARTSARANYVLVGALLWSAPGHLVGYVAEPAWGYVFFPLLAYGAWRGATVRVREEPDALLVRNLVLSFRIPWRDVGDVKWKETLVLLPGYVVPHVFVPGRSRRLPVLGMPCWMTPSREDDDRARRWSGAPPTTSRRAPRRRGRR